MATIALYANRINNMPSLLGDVKSAVNDLKSEFNSLKRKCNRVESSICNLDEVVSTVSAATKLQEDKVTALQNLQDDIAEFADEAARIDGAVVDIIQSNKEDFYDKYSYLKPNCEKNGWEKFCDGCKKVNQWCAENWEAICVAVVAIIAVVAIVAISVVTFGAGAVAVAALVGALVGVAGQFIGDAITFVRTGKWEGSFTDYLAAAVGGAIGGILTMTGNAVVACAVDSAITSLLSDSLGSMFGGEKKTMGEMLVNASFNAAIGAFAGWASGKLMDKVVDCLPKNSIFTRRLTGRGSYEASYNMVLTKLRKGIIKNFTKKTIRNGVINGLVGDFAKNIASGLGILDIPLNLVQQSGLSTFVDNCLDKKSMAKQFHWSVMSVVTGMPILSVFGILPTGWLFGGTT